MKILLTDLDGTLRTTLSGAKFISKPHDQQIITKSSQALRNWLKAHFEGKLEHVKIIGITNQGGIQARHKTLENCIIEQQITIKLLAEEEIEIDSIYFCPDYSGYECYKVTKHSSEVVANNQGDFVNFKSQLKFSPLAIRGKFRKPNAGMLEVARLSHNSHTSECLYIGDMDDDKEAAKNANMAYLDILQFQKIYF